MFQIRIFKFIKCNRAARRVVHVVAHREHLARRTDVAQNVNLAAVFLEAFFGGLLCDFHGCTVHLGNAMFLMVFVLAYALARERVRREAIDTRIHVTTLDVENNLGLFDGEHVVVGALDPVSLDNRAHAAIEQHHL